jgi:hypothetical protein
MKNFIVTALLILLASSGSEYVSGAGNNQQVTATLKSSTRLFKDKMDLTSVITIIPQGESVVVLGADSIYLHVVYDENEGYILSRHATIDKVAAAVQSSRQDPGNNLASNKADDRYTYLVNQYGENMAARLYAGKIWKGLNSEMVKDSWGPADRINRVVSGNIVKEEWIYRSSWLYFENNTLVKWGPVQKK